MTLIVLNKRNTFFLDVISLKRKIFLKLGNLLTVYNVYTYVYKYLICKTNDKGVKLLLDNAT